MHNHKPQNRATFWNDGTAFWNALSAREREIVRLVVTGLSNKEIGRRLGLTEGTIKIRLHTLYKKIGVSSRTELAARIFATRSDFASSQ
jgi:DNA-binding NarL/FixJ family response regulator